MIAFPREDILEALQLVNGVVEKRQAKPILSNILLNIAQDQQQLIITATDLEIELVVRLPIKKNRGFTATTVDCKKLMGIIKALPIGSLIKVEQQDNRLVIKNGPSKFILSTLPAEEFPKLECHCTNVMLTFSQKTLQSLLKKTFFSMAEQDVRYYLNGLLLDIEGDRVSAIAADGHRLAISSYSSHFPQQSFRLIIPRKAIVELLRLLKDSDDEVVVKFGDNSMTAETKEINFTTKLIEGKFPEYRKIIPKSGNFKASIPIKQFKEALHRMAILTHQKHRGVSCKLSNNQLYLRANNLEQEEAEEHLEIEYNDKKIELGFNVDYLLDIVNTVSGQDRLAVTITDDRTGVLFELPKDSETCYVIMPMRL